MFKKLSRNLEDIKNKIQIEHLDTGWVNDRLDITKKKIGKLEDTAITTIRIETQREHILKKKIKQNICKMGKDFKQPNKHLIEVLEGKGRRAEKNKEIMAKNFSKFD